MWFVYYLDPYIELGMRRLRAGVIWLGYAAGWIFIWAWVAFLFSGFITLGLQGVIWLRDGVWPSIPLWRSLVYFGFPVPFTSWVGLQRIISFGLTIEVGLWLIVSSAVFTYAMIQMANWRNR